MSSCKEILNIFHNNSFNENIIPVVEKATVVEQLLMGIVLVDRDAEELLSEMFVFVVCVFCISIGFSGVSRDSVMVPVIVGVGEVCFDIFRGVSDIVVVSVDIVDT